MKTSRGHEPTLKLSHAPVWPPKCVMRRADPDPHNPTQGCDFVGEPNEFQSPYRACWGDYSKHTGS